MPYHRTAYLKWFKNYFVCVCVGVHGYVHVHVDIREQFRGAGPLLLSCDPRDQTQVI